MGVGASTIDIAFLCSLALSPVSRIAVEWAIHSVGEDKLWRNACRFVGFQTHFHHSTIAGEIHDFHLIVVGLVDIHRIGAHRVGVGHLLAVVNHLADGGIGGLKHTLAIDAKCATFRFASHHKHAPSTESDGAVGSDCTGDRSGGAVNTVCQIHRASPDWTVCRMVVDFTWGDGYGASSQVVGALQRVGHAPKVVEHSVRVVHLLDGHHAAHNGCAVGILSVVFGGIEHIWHRRWSLCHTAGTLYVSHLPRSGLKLLLQQSHSLFSSGVHFFTGA